MSNISPGSAMTLSPTRGLAAPLLLVACALAALLWLLPDKMIGDESVHFLQAKMFAHGEWTIHPALATWPTTNALVALFMKVAGSEALWVARAVISLFALLAAVAFARLAACFDPADAPMRTLQFFLLPVVLPYCGLVYTDIPALAALLWMFAAAMRGEPVGFCAAGLLAVAVRQSNIFWLLAGTAAYLHQAQYRSGISQNTAVGFLPGWRVLRQQVRVLAFVAFVLAVWLVVVACNGSVTLGPATQDSHLMKPRGLPNMEFLMGLAGLLFAPLLVPGWRRFREALHPLRRMVVLLAVAAFIAATFAVKHFDNTDVAAVEAFLRNRVLHAIVHNGLLWPFAFFAALSACCLASLPMHEEAGRRWLFWLVCGLYLLPFWLIEQRYYLPVFALFWAARKPVGRSVEWLQLGWGALLSAAVLWMIVSRNMFI